MSSLYVPSRLLLPQYSFSEADYLARATKGTSRRWIEGYSYQRRGERRTQPPVTPGTGGGNGASFVDLIEVVAIAQLKDIGFNLPAVRKIVENCQELLGVPRPLATQKFKTDGREIFVEKDGALLEVGRRKRMTAWDEVLAPFLEQLDYSDGWVERWWPLGKELPVVVDPEYGFGQPVIAGSGVRTEIVLERVRAGDLPEEIAEDFNLEPVEVHRAIQFEMSRQPG
jgi:uncharacterized protein (DUF433 family)